MVFGYCVIFVKEDEVISPCFWHCLLTLSACFSFLFCVHFLLPISFVFTNKGYTLVLVEQLGMGKHGRFVANLSESESISDSDNKALSASPEATEDSEGSDSTLSKALVNESSSEEGACSIRETVSKGKRVINASSSRTEKGKKARSVKNRK